MSEPSRDPSMDGSLVGLLTGVLNKFMATSVDDMLPAIVQEYDAAKNRARVKIVIKIVTTDNRIIDRAVIQSIPVFQIGAGGYGLFFNNIQAGDLGWVKASDRDISLFLQNYKEATPNTQRLHSFEDAVFFPDIMRGWDRKAGEHAVLQNLAGTVKIALKASSIDILAGTVNIGAKVNLGSGGPAIARVGDAITIDAPTQPWDGATGTITSGSSNHTAN